MKTHNIRILFLIAQFFLGVGLSSGASFSYEGLNYTTLTTEDGSREVEVGLNYDLPSSTVTVPAEVEDEGGNKYRVVGIAANAFYTSGARNAVVNLEIADNPYFRYIGDNSFRLCSRLKGIALGALPALERIGNNSFESCSLLSEINFENATGLKSIGANAFQGCSLGSVRIKSDNLKSLGNYVFAENTSLTSVNIESGALTSTGNYAFNNCTSLSEVNLKCQALEEIGAYAFYYCGALDKFNIDESGNIMYIRSCAFNNCTKLPFSLELVPKLRRIEYRAFYNATTFTKKNLDFHVTPDLEYLGSNAFYGATFTEVDLSDHEGGLSLYWTFSQLKSLRKVNLSNCPGLTMEGRVFYQCTNLQSLDLSGSGPLTEISEYMFCETNLSDFKMDYSGVTKIGNDAFYSSKITELDLSKAENLTEIGKYAFAKCSKLNIVKLPASLEKIYNSAFEYTNFNQLVCFAPEPPEDPNGTHDGTIRLPFYESQMLKKGVLYVPIESVKKYKEATIWKDIPVIRPFGYYENMSLPEKCEAYVGAEKEISISWQPEEAPFPGKVEWYIKEQNPDKFGIADLTPSDKPESVIVKGCLPGEYTLVARVRVEKEDKDEYVELESPLVIEYCPMEVVFNYPEYTFSGPGIDKWFSASAIPEGSPMTDVYYVASDYNVAVIWHQEETGMFIMSSSPGTTDVYAMRNDEILGKMTIRVQADRITSIKSDKDFLEIYSGNRGTMRIIPDEPDFANPGDLTWTVKTGGDCVEMEVSEDTWSASFKGLSTGEALVEVTYKGIKTTFKVYVIDGDVESVTTDSENYTVRMNNDLEIFPSTTPVVFPSTTYTYTIKDKEIAQIIENEEGRVFIHPLSIGKTELKVSLASNPDLFAKAEIEVKAETPLTEILIEGERHPLIEMMEGERRELSLSIAPLDASDALFRWSTDASGAQLQMEPSEDSQKLMIEALKSGHYLLSATALDGSGLTATAEISVGRIEPESIRILQPENDIIVGDDSQILKAVISPDNASETLLAWNVSDENILTLEEVSNDEVRIHPNSSGTTVVFVMMTQEPWLMDMAVVKVWSRDEIRSISLAEEDLMLGVGGAPYKLTPVVAPADSEIPLLLWESANESVAIVDENGYVTAVAPGSTVIRATLADNPELTAVCKVTVSATRIDDLSLDKEEVEIVEGWSEIVTATFSNAEAYPELAWSVSDSEIASITAYPFTNGVRIEGLMPGECELKVSCEGLTAVCKVVVLERPARNITIRMAGDYLALGSSGMEATIDYDHKELGRPDVIWSSSNENVARIEDNGDGTVRIIPVNTGECEIRVEEHGLPDSYDVRGITVGYATGVSGVFADDDAVYDLFDIDGRVIRLEVKVSEIKQLSPGIYLLRRGNEMIKIMIK